MKLKFSRKEKEYLIGNFKKENLRVEDIFTEDTAVIDIGEDLAEMIRDWANNKIQEIGFDINYDLTEDGKILESLVYKFSL